MLHYTCLFALTRVGLACRAPVVTSCAEAIARLLLASAAMSFTAAAQSAPPPSVLSHVGFPGVSVPPSATTSRPVPAADTGAQAGVGVLTLDAVVALVVARNPQLLAAGARARALEARVPGASRPPDPQVQLGLMNRSLPGMGPDPALGMTQLQVMQMLPLRGKLSAATAAMRARADAGTARARDAAWEARADAAMAFYERYQAAGSVVLTQETRRLLDDAADIARAMYRVGNGRQADVLRAQVEVARMDEEIVRMTVMAEVAQARLAVAADTLPEVFAGAPQLPVFPDSLPALADLERRALASRPMLAAGNADVRAAAADALLAHRELWPDLQLGLQYGQRSMSMGVDRMGSLMIGASLPVFARSRQMRMREETAAMQQMAEAELTAMRAETRGRLASAYTTLTSTRRLRTLYRTTVLPQAEATSASALAAYRTGAVDFMTVIDNQMSVNRYRQELLQLDATEGRTWAELEMLVGRSLLTSIPMDSSHMRDNAGGRQ